MLVAVELVGDSSRVQWTVSRKNVIIDCYEPHYPTSYCVVILNEISPDMFACGAVLWYSNIIVFILHSLCTLKTLQPFIQNCSILKEKWKFKCTISSIFIQKLSNLPMISCFYRKWISKGRKMTSRLALAGRFRRLPQSSLGGSSLRNMITDLCELVMKAIN